MTKGKRLKVLRKGWKVRRAVSPRSEVGRARKAQVFTVAEVVGYWDAGHCRALLRGHGQAFWTETPEDWERA